VAARRGGESVIVPCALGAALFEGVSDPRSLREAIAPLVFLIVAALVALRIAGLGRRELDAVGVTAWAPGDLALVPAAAAVSLIATSFAADTPLWITGIMRRGGGVSANWYWWSFLFGHVLAVFVFSKLWRRAAVMTNIEITEVRFAGRPAAALRLMKSLYLALPINLGVIVWCTLAMQKVLEAVLGVSRMEATAVCLVLSVAY